MNCMTVTIANTTVAASEVIAALESVGVRMISVRERPSTHEDLAIYGVPELVDGPITQHLTHLRMLADRHQIIFGVQLAGVSGRLPERVFHARGRIIVDGEEHEVTATAPTVRGAEHLAAEGLARHLPGHLQLQNTEAG